jgi:hypothetical protein
VKQFTSGRRVFGYPKGWKKPVLERERYENPTIGILVVQVRRIRAIPGDVFQLAGAASVTVRLIFVSGSGN